MRNALSRWFGSLALLIVCLASGQASAQSGPPVYSPFGRPQLSPYLNLLRTRNPAAVNYYLGTLPEQQRRQQYSQLRTGVLQLDQRYAQQQQRTIAESGDPLEVVPLSGGHPSFFLNTSHYFNLNRPNSGNPNLQPRSR